MVFLAAIGPWKSTQEQPKVAIYQQWLPAFLALSVHVIPLAAALTMLSINFRITASTTEVSTTSLQYLAKALELVTQASISAVALTYLQRDYTSSDGVPFGAITAGLQLNSLSYLWSLDFFGSLWSPAFPLRRKLTFAVFILFATLLTATVGPSIATCLIPRPVYLSGKYYPLDPKSTIYPQRIETSGSPDHCEIVNQTLTVAQSYNRSNIICPSEGWESLGQLITTAITKDRTDEEYLASFSTKASYRYKISSQKANSTRLGPELQNISNKLENLRGYSVKQFPKRSILLAAPTWFTLSVQNTLRLFSPGSGQFRKRLPLKISLRALSPVAVSFCQKPDNSTRQDGSLPADSTLFQFENPFTNEPSTVGFPETAGYTANDRTWKISWSHANGSNISIIALLSNWTESGYRRHMVCPVIAGWADSTQTITENGYPDVSDVHWAREAVEISEDWASLLAPSFGDSNSSVIDQLGQIISFVPYLQRYNGGDLGYSSYFSDTHSLIVSGMVVNGMSGHGHKQFSSIGYWRKSNASTYSISYQSYYDGPAAYSSQGLSVKLSLAVLVSYVAYTLAFIIFSIGFNRTASSAWDSISELTALALLSKPPEKSLKNTRAGIETVELFKRQVHIRVVENDNLEIVFKEEDPNRKTESIVKNKAY
ncbi:uncharacterized protein J3D65DRAFT_606927 [Phyllosticta citribraziliensis]|uniref:Uncharacterized protein n=1 Tax=Phyllosticta citribraziliensis TaxID=989973 RepID=A0ABR1L607_9PEZI